MTSLQPLSPAQAIAAYRESAANADALLRAIARHRAWYIGAEPLGSSLRAVVAREDDGTRTLRVYSSETAHAEASRAGDSAAAAYAMPGWHLLAMLSAVPVDRVAFDPGSAQSVHYNADQFELLSGWAATAAVEQAVDDPDSIADPFAALGRYSGWTLLQETIDELPALVMAPDADGRRLAAVFTSHDVAEAFRVKFRDHLAQTVEFAVRDGADLFAWLGSLPIDGFVINPGGLLEPRAFALSVCEPILEALS